MSYIRFPSDPHPPSGDQSVNERVKIISTDDDPDLHQDAINIYLLLLRDLTTYVAIIRGIETFTVQTTGPPTLTFYSVIRYTLIGEPAPPP